MNKLEDAKKILMMRGYYCPKCKSENTFIVNIQLFVV